MKALELTLTNSHVVAVKERYEARAGRKIGLPFDLLFERLKSDDCRLSDIAKDAGVSRQAIHFIYNRYFRDLFGDRTGRERQKVSAEKKNTERNSNKYKRRQIFNIIREKFLFAKVSTIGDELKMEITLNVGLDGLWGFICLNSFRCLFHTSNKVFWSNAHAKYYSYSIQLHRLEQTEFVIFHGQDKEYSERIFIVPTHILKNRFTEGDSRKFFYLPVEKVVPYNNMFPKIDFWQYENAWYLLKLKQSK